MTNSNLIQYQTFLKCSQQHSCQIVFLEFQSTDARYRDLTKKYNNLTKTFRDINTTQTLKTGMTATEGHFINILMAWLMTQHNMF